MTGASVFAVTGCTGVSEDTDAAETDLEVAGEYLSDNKELLDEFEEASSVTFDGDVPEFDHSTFQMNTQKARSHIDAAEDAAPETYADEIEVYRALLAYHEEIGACNQRLNEYLVCLDTMGSMIDADRWDDASDHHQECVEKLRDVESRLDRSIDVWSSVDTSKLDDIGQIEYESLDEELAVDRDELSVMFDFHDGLQLFLDGTVEMVDAFDHMENEDISAAKRGLSRAEGEFATAADTFEGLESHPDLRDDLRSDVIEMVCFSGALRDATGHYYNALDAYQNGNESRAEEELDAGDAALERCEF